MNELITNYILGTLIFWSYYFLCHRTLTKFSSNFISLLSMVVLYAIASCCYFYIDVLSQLEYISYIFGMLPFILTPLLFRDEFRKLLYVFSFNFICATIWCNLTLFILQSHTYLLPIEVINNKLPIYVFSLVLYFILFVFVFNRSIKKAIQTDYHYSMSFISFTFLIETLLIITYPYLYYEINLVSIAYNELLIILNIGFFLITFILHLFLCLKKSNQNVLPAVIDTKVKEKELPKQEESMEASDIDLLKNKYIDNILLGYQVIENKICMDKETYQKLSQSLVNSSSLSAKVYLDQLELESQSYRLKHLCDSDIINKVMAFYQYQYLEVGIYLHVNIELKEELVLNEVDLSFIIAHFLENAKKASLASTIQEEPYINFYIKNKDNHIMMIIDVNSDKENALVDPLYESLVKSMKGKIDIHNETKFSPSNMLSMYIDITQLS
ncbi:MAG: hypothetical protein RSH23_06155 [Erysipelotrichaceae bacterium]